MRPTGRARRHFRHRVKPVGLALAAHHEQVTTRGREIDPGGPIFAEPRVGVSRLQQPRPARTECEDRDHGVLAVAQVGVAVWRHAVTAVAVVRETDTAERHSVVVLNCTVRRGQRRVRVRRVTRVPAPHARLVEVPLVPEDPALLPADLLDEERVELVGAEQPTPRHVDPRLVVEPSPFGRRVGIDRDVGRHGARVSPRRSAGSAAQVVATRTRASRSPDLSWRYWSCR